MAIIVGCVGLGAFVGLLPLVAGYERQKNEALDERQRALEALSRTVAASAEQISIAATGLHEIAELAQKNLRQAEQLPHKLQDKIAEFQAQLAQVNDTDKEELERELLALRTTESERLETVSQRIAKSAADWAKIEAATQQHLTAATEALAKLQLGTANAIGKAQAAAEQALAQARIEAARGLGETAGQAMRAIETARAAAIADIQCNTRPKVTTAAQPSLATESPAQPPASVPAPIDDTPAETETTHPFGNPAESDTVHPFNMGAAAAPGTSVPDTKTEPVNEPPDSPISAPKRPRRTRREEPAPALAETPATAESASQTNATVTAEIVAEPAPIPPQKFTEISAVAPHTAVPFPNAIVTDNGAVNAPAPTLPVESDKPARKRAQRKNDADAGPLLGLELDDPTSRAAAAGVLERVLSSDGATRILVTAYIGIGNRLFIRGEGPGLSWDKGIPLQFVSIGKWRWETSDAAAPVQFKLYKNDDLECAALGTQTIEPGHQQEVTAAF